MSDANPVTGQVGTPTVSGDLYHTVLGTVGISSIGGRVWVPGTEPEPAPYWPTRYWPIGNEYWPVNHWPNQ